MKTAMPFIAIMNQKMNNIKRARKFLLFFLCLVLEICKKYDIINKLIKKRERKIKNEYKSRKNRECK